MDGVCGIPNAGTPIVEALSAFYTPPLAHITLLKEESDGKRKISGIGQHAHFVPGNIILLFDDVISEADSKLEAINILRKNGFIVNDVVVIVDREMGGRAELRKIGVELHALFTLNELCQHYVETGRVTPEQADRVATYLAMCDLDS